MSLSIANSISSYDFSLELNIISCDFTSAIIAKIISPIDAASTPNPKFLFNNRQTTFWDMLQQHKKLLYYFYVQSSPDFLRTEELLLHI